MESRSIIGKYLHCDFCGLNDVPSIDMNIINHVPQKQIDYNPELEVNEKCEQCSDNQSNSFNRRLFICNACKDIVFIPLAKTIYLKCSDKLGDMVKAMDDNTK